jgi:uncharacterized protein YegL
VGSAGSRTQLYLARQSTEEYDAFYGGLLERSAYMSTAALVMGILGGLFGLLVGLFGYSVGGIVGATGQKGTGLFQLISIAIPIGSFVGAGLAKANPRMGGALMILSTVAMLWLFGFNFFTAIPVGLTAAGGALALLALDASKASAIVTPGTTSTATGQTIAGPAADVYQTSMAKGIFGTHSKNYSQRVPCVVVMDCSASMGAMGGKPIDSLNKGLAAFERELKADDNARRAARVMLISVGGSGPTQVTVRTPFQDGDDFTAPSEVASGSTPLGEAVLLALDKIQQEKAYLRSKGLSYHRPWLFVMSDGEPTDGETWHKACDMALEASRAKKLSIFPIAVDGGNVRELQK